MNNDSKSGIAVIVVIAAVAIAFAVNLFAGNHSEDEEKRYYDDQLGLLAESTKKDIQEVNADLKENYGGAELFVAIVETTGDKSISKYATEYFNKTTIGSSANNNGLLLVVSRAENTYSTVYGSGLDDSFAGHIAVVLKNYMEPQMAEENIDAAVAAVVTPLEKILKNECARWYSAKNPEPTEKLVPTATPTPTAKLKPTKAPKQKETDNEVNDRIADSIRKNNPISWVGMGIGFVIKMIFKLIAGLFSSVLIGLIVVIIIIRAIVKSAKK